MAAKAEQIILKGHKDGSMDNANYLEQVFTPAERQTALSIAQKWHQRGWMPFCYTTSYNGPVQVIYNFRSRKQSRKAA